METIYIAIIVFALVVIVIGTVFFIYNNKNDQTYSNPKQESIKAKSKVSEPKSSPSTPNTKDVSNKIESGLKDSSEGTLDQQYADKNRMWVCQYCETLNSYPKGITIPKKKDNDSKPKNEEVLSGLRGDLFHKTKTSESKEATDEIPILYCVACGKQL